MVHSSFVENIKAKAKLGRGERKLTALMPSPFSVTSSGFKLQLEVQVPLPSWAQALITTLPDPSAAEWDSSLTTALRESHWDGHWLPRIEVTGKLQYNFPEKFDPLPGKRCHKIEQRSPSTLKSAQRFYPDLIEASSTVLSLTLGDIGVESKRQVYAYTEMRASNAVASKRDKDPRYLDLDPPVYVLTARPSSCQCNDIPRLRDHHQQSEFSFPFFYVVPNDSLDGAGFRDTTGNKGPATDERSFRSMRVNQARQFRRFPVQLHRFPQLAWNSRKASSAPAIHQRHRQHPRSSRGPRQPLHSTRYIEVDTNDTKSVAPTYAPLPLKYIINAIDFNFIPSSISTSIGDTRVPSPKPHRNPVKLHEPVPAARVKRLLPASRLQAWIRIVRSIPVAAMEAMFPTFNITINDTAPFGATAGEKDLRGIVRGNDLLDQRRRVRFHFAAFPKIAHNSGSSSASASADPTANPSSCTRASASAENPSSSHRSGNDTPPRRHTGRTTTHMSLARVPRRAQRAAYDEEGRGA
ncbi:hypothetical protein FB451DRAFT_1176147 [Mycena latifolia]|nr:hypothetical protein FB451DRAFT_1176147 [Mycena latifolia]